MAPGSKNSTQEKVVEDEFQHPIEDGIVVLDGGFATQLSCHVNKQIDGDVLWSARFLATDPEAVIETHLDFLRAGADVIMTNTYQASIGGFMEHLGLTERQSYDLIKKSVEYARIACERYEQEYSDPEQSKPRPLIVGSVGPYGASLHDGSEYTGSYVSHTSLETMRDWHKPRINALLEGGVDLLGIETIPSKAEAEMLVNLLKTDYPGVKAWLSFTVRQDGKSISYGDNFQESAKYCYDLNPNQLVAVGVNCVAPRLVEPLFKDFNKNRERNPVPLIVYPNSGEIYNVELGWIDRDKCEPIEHYIPHWLDMGITWVGGCCRTYAADVSRILNQAKKWSHEKKSKEQNGFQNYT